MAGVYTLSAQKKGDMSLSGTLSWTSNSTTTTIKSEYKDESQTSKGDRSFSVMPEFHYFIADNLSVGLGMGYSLYKTPNGLTGWEGEQLFDKLYYVSVQPVAKYYIALNEQFYFVPRFYFGFLAGKYVDILDREKTEKVDVSGFNIGLSLLNFEFKPCGKVGVVFSAGDLKYESYTECWKGYNSDGVFYPHKEKRTITGNKFSLGLNLGATVGFNYYFGK